VVDAFFLKDLIMNFMTAYFTENRVLVKDREMIMNNYLRGWFTIDFLSIVPYDTIGSAIESDLLNELKSLRLFRLMRLLKLFRVLRAGR